MNKKREQDKQCYRDPYRIAEDLLTDKFMHIPEVSDDKAFGPEERDGAAFTLVYWQGDFYRWQDGCYYRISDSDMRATVTQHMQGLKDRAEDDTQDVRITTGNVNNVLLCLKAKIHIPSDREANSWADCREKVGIYSIAFNNGILLYYPHEADPHPVLAKPTPHFFNVVKLLYGYDPEARCNTWLVFLDDVMQGDQGYVKLLQQWCGYLLRPDLREHKFLMCPGEGANGKGVLSEVVEAFVGVDNCSHVSLARFSDPFALYGTLGRLVNITSESSHLIDNEGESLLKAYVAGDRFTFERKFKDPIHAVPTAKVMISTNSLPRFNDKTQGIWRRILLVPFGKTIPESAQIKGLAQEIIKTELPGIFNWALQGLASLNKENGFSVPRNNSELLEDYRRDSDPTRAFLTENYTYSPNALGVPCKDVYAEYKTYCDENGCRPTSSRNFGQQVRRIFPEITRGRPGSGNSRPWIYEGLVAVTSQTSQGTLI